MAELTATLNVGEEALKVVEAKIAARQAEIDGLRHELNIARRQIGDTGQMFQLALKDRDEARAVAHEYMIALADDSFTDADERWAYIQQQRARFPWLKE